MGRLKLLVNDAARIEARARKLRKEKKNTSGPTWSLAGCCTWSEGVSSYTETGVSELARCGMGGGLREE